MYSALACVKSRDYWYHCERYCTLNTSHYTESVSSASGNWLYWFFSRKRWFLWKLACFSSLTTPLFISSIAFSFNPRPGHSFKDFREKIFRENLTKRINVPCEKFTYRICTAIQLLPVIPAWFSDNFRSQTINPGRPKLEKWASFSGNYFLSIWG